MIKTIMILAIPSVIVLLMLFPISNVYAVPITSIFSSGLDGSGNPLPGGASDTHYEVVETGNQAVVRTSLPVTYFPNDANSQWIWENANGQPTNVIRTLKTTFDLTGMDPSTAQIAMLVGVDNQLLDIEINGVSTGQQLLGVVVGNFAMLHPFSINSGFQPGINTLEFIVQDNGVVSAFRVEITSATADPPKDHYLAYEVEGTTEFAESVVILTDQFGSGVFEVKEPIRLYNPVDKNGEVITDPNTHLVGYEIESVDDDDDEVIPLVLVTNQFGDIILDVEEEKLLLVPSAKDLDSTPPPLGNTFVDHYKCYEVEVADDTPEFEERLVTLSDQFGSGIFEVKEPKILCNPVDKNGEGIIDLENHLLCYDVEREDDEDEEERSVFTNNQFGPEELEVEEEEQLCVPSTKIVIDEAPDDDDDDD